MKDHQGFLFLKISNTLGKYRKAQKEMKSLSLNNKFTILVFTLFIVPICSESIKPIKFLSFNFLFSALFQMVGWSSIFKLILHNVPIPLLLLAFHVHLFFALLHNFRAALPLLVAFGLAYAFLIYHKLLRDLIPELSDGIFKRVQSRHNSKIVTVMKIALPTLLIIAFLIWLIIDSVDSRIRLRSLLGFFAFFCLCFSVSAHPFKVNWHPVIGGIILQVFVGLVILRWPPGFIAFEWASKKVVTFLGFASNGTRFVYGFVADPPNICGMSAIFMFSALQIIIYFGAIVAILYHFGIMQFFLSRFATFVHWALGTTCAESVNAAACIFVGQTESALLIAPSIGTMTPSEVHAIMTTGFACIAGSLFSAYISFGACPIHLLSATIMNAAISLGISKLVYPETEESKHKSFDGLEFAQRDKGESMLECISKSAVQSARFVMAIGANLLVYIALLALLNALLGWAGTLIGFNELSFNKILSFLFFPLAWAMGASDAEDFHVAIDETMKVAELMGIKTVLNEFIAYKQLSEWVANGTLNGTRARMIATYALCGFSNISMIGTQIGLLSAICPEKKRIFAQVAIRAFIAGVFSCFLTTCVAGMLVNAPIVCQSAVHGQKCIDLEQFIGVE